MYVLNYIKILFIQIQIQENYLDAEAEKIAFIIHNSGHKMKINKVESAFAKMNKTLLYCFFTFALLLQIKSKSNYKCLQIRHELLAIWQPTLKDHIHLRTKMMMIVLAQIEDCKCPPSWQQRQQSKILHPNENMMVLASVNRRQNWH